MIKISVIIPTWRRAKELSEVCKALCSQSFKLSEFEVIICDSNSDDDTAEILKTYNNKINIVHFHSKVNAQSVKRNDGARISKGEILVFLDDDVVPSNELLDIYYNKHQESNNEVLLGLSLFSSSKAKKSNFIRYRNHRSIKVIKFSNNVPSKNFVSMNFSIKKSDFMKIGMFDENFVNYGGEDHDFPCRMEQLGFKSVLLQDARSEHIEPNPILVNRMKKIYISARYGFIPLKEKFPEFFNNNKLQFLEESQNNKFSLSIMIILTHLFLNKFFITKIISFLRWADSISIIYIPIFYRMVFAAAYFEGVKDRKCKDKNHQPYFIKNN